MNKQKTQDKYVFPEFARGTFTEHLENELHKAPRNKAKAEQNFWRTLAKFLGEREINVNL